MRYLLQFLAISTKWQENNTKKYKDPSHENSGVFSLNIIYNKAI